ncbi:MAG: hypothetical protein HY927_14865 [Elusimicrobia bacterium]|nr:hypothetical protein [Elusimicrobiota bacterium]
MAFHLAFSLLLSARVVAVELGPVPWSDQPVPRPGCMSLREAGALAARRFPYRIDKESLLRTVLAAPMLSNLARFELERAVWADRATPELSVIDRRPPDPACEARLSGYSARLDLHYLTPAKLSRRGLRYGFKVEEIAVPLKDPAQVRSWSRRYGAPSLLGIDKLIQRAEAHPKVAAFLDRFPQAAASMHGGGAKFESGGFRLAYDFAKESPTEYSLPPDIRPSAFPEFAGALAAFDPVGTLRAVMVHSRRCRESGLERLAIDRIEGRYWENDQEWSGSLHFAPNPCVDASNFRGR